MLAKYISNDPKIKESFRALIEYIAAANEKGEELDHFWMVNSFKTSIRVLLRSKPHKALTNGQVLVVPII